MRTVMVPDFGDSGSWWQPVQVLEPVDPGYPTGRLPEGDPWAPAVNRAIDEIRAEWEAEPEPEPEAGL
jgi:hypothetical protein